MLEAVGGLPVRVLLTLGASPAEPASSTHPRTSRSASSSLTTWCLPHMAAVVSHGGLSTITAALTAGVPLVCIPQGRDQYHNAARVAATGVGRTVRHRCASRRRSRRP